MPILVYGSDVWVARKDGPWSLDKVFLRFVRCILGIKATTSNIIVAGECRRLPPSTQCTIHALCYMNRVMNMNEGPLVKQVYQAYMIKDLTPGSLECINSPMTTTWFWARTQPNFIITVKLLPEQIILNNGKRICPIWIAIRFWERTYTSNDHSKLNRIYT